MKVKFIANEKREQVCKTGSTVFLLPFSGEIEITGAKQPAIYINGDAYIPENGKYRISVGNESLDVSGDNESYHFVNLCQKHTDEDLFEYDVLGQNFENNLINNSIDEEIFDDALTTDDEATHILLCTFSRKFDTITTEMDLDTISEYSVNLPHIFYKPKMHLKQINEIRPAAIASRTGSESIRYLASHSEHWKGIRASGLVPEKLLARVLEDDDAIYENIAAKTLVDRLYVTLRKLREDNLDCAMQIEMDDGGQSVSSEQKSYFHARDILLHGMNEDKVSYNQMMLEDQLEKIDHILEEVGKCRSTLLFRNLRKKKHIHGKLKKTNIFMMDKYYKYVYKIWNLMGEKSEIIAQNELKPISYEYELFCKLLFVFALHFFNYSLDKPNADVMEGTLIADADYSFAKWHIHTKDVYINNLDVHGFSVNISVTDKVHVNCSQIEGMQELSEQLENCEFEDDALVFDHILTDAEQNAVIDKAQYIWLKNKRSWNTQELKHRLYAAFYNADRKEKSLLFIPWKYRIPDSMEGIRQLRSLLKDKIQDGYDEVYILTLSRPNDLENVNDVQSLNYLDSYGIANNKKGLEDDHFGMIPMSLADINSYRRYTKILLRQMVNLDSAREICPICGEKLYTNSSNQWTCRNCGFEIIDTKCPECGKEYSFTRYYIPKVASAKSDLPGFKILYEENRRGYKNITECVLDQNEDGKQITIKPICPYCGK